MSSVSVSTLLFIIFKKIIRTSKVSKGGRRLVFFVLLSFYIWHESRVLFKALRLYHSGASCEVQMALSVSHNLWIPLVARKLKRSKSPTTLSDQPTTQSRSENSQDGHQKLNHQYCSPLDREYTNDIPLIPQKCQ